MRLHGITIAGIVVTVAGWLWLVFGVGIALPDSSRSVFGAQSVVNLQLLSLAEQTCMLGYVLILAGVLVSGFDWLRSGYNAPVGQSSAPPAMAVARNTGNLDRMSGTGFKFREID